MLFKFYTNKGHRYVIKRTSAQALAAITPLLGKGESIMFFSKVRYTARNLEGETGKLHPKEMPGV